MGALQISFRFIEVCMDQRNWSDGLYNRQVKVNLILLFWKQTNNE